MNFDVTIIGAGVVGIAISFNLTKKGYKVLLIDKEKNFGMHTSSRNTEIIHAGIYYKPNTFKAKFCIKGKELLYDFCNQYNVNYKKCGKVFVGHNLNDLKNFDTIINRSKLNGLDDIYEINKNKVKKIEPNLIGNYFLISPSSGIFDSHQFMQTLLNISCNYDFIFSPNTELLKADLKKDHIVMHVIEKKFTKLKIKTKLMINSSGNYSIELFKKAFKEKTNYSSLPVKGNYVTYSGKSLINSIIYPPIEPGNIVPRVDAINDMNNVMKFGPDVEIPKSFDDYSINVKIIDDFYREISKYLKSVNKKKLNISYSGIRPKIKYKDSIYDDFVMEWYQNSCLNLFGFDSPALTSSLAIGSHVCDLVEQRLK